MFSRINFLFAVAALTVLVFYLVGRFVILVPLAAVAPAWAVYAGGAIVLIALALIVRTLSRVVANLEDLTNLARVQPSGFPGLAGQVSILFGHVSFGASIYLLIVSGGADSATRFWALAFVLYAAGVGSALLDWRRRARLSNQ